jgi:hypothetical protein
MVRGDVGDSDIGIDFCGPGRRAQIGLAHLVFKTEHSLRTS